MYLDSFFNWMENGGMSPPMVFSRLWYQRTIERDHRLIRCVFSGEKSRKDILLELAHNIVRQKELSGDMTNRILKKKPEKESSYKTLRKLVMLSIREEALIEALSRI